MSSSVERTRSSIADRLIGNERTTVRKRLLTTAHKLTGGKLPLLVLWIRGISNDTIDVLSNVLGRNGSPHVNPLVQQRDVNRCGLRGIYRLTRQSSAAAGGSERGLKWKCFHNLKRSIRTASGWLQRFG